MAIYKLSNEELESVLATNTLYSNGLNKITDQKILYSRGNTVINCEDLGNVIILRRKGINFEDCEINFSGDGCYLSCLYVNYSSSQLIHSVDKTKEKSLDSNGKVSLFTGYFGRSKSGKLTIKRDTKFDLIHIIAKQPLIKEIAQIDGIHSKIFELEYQQKCEKSILVESIYSPNAILIIEQMLNTLYVGKLRDKFIEMKTIELILHLMYIGQYGESEFDVKDVLAHRIMLYIESNFRKNISLQKISKDLKISGTTIRNRFRSTYNINIFEMVNNLRMRDVDKLLKLGYTFSEIANKLNYKNQTDLKNRYHIWNRK